MSEPAYDHKYSDRDVRENPELRDLAIAYIDKYGGSFEPLLKIKQYIAYHGVETLATIQIRLVLNCMRHDPEVAGTLPAPKFGTPDGRGAVVIPMQRDRRRRPAVAVVTKNCGRTQPHDEHWISMGVLKCEGVPWKVNRYGLVPTRGRIKGKPFAVTVSGSLVHKVEGEAIFYWSPNQHEWGFREGIPSRFSVKVMCKNPSWLKDPNLYAEEPVHLYSDESFGKGRCARCFTAEELREPPPKPNPSLMPLFLPPEA